MFPDFIKKIIIFSILIFVIYGCSNPSDRISIYNVVWETPSQNSLGSMPSGNGDIGINLWVEKNGDLIFYLSKTDAWSENGRLLKLGKIKIALNPNPFVTGKKFRQELVLKNGIINIQAGEGKEKVSINVWVDANHPVVEVDIESESKIEATATLELWRNKRRALKEGDERWSAYGICKTDLDIFVEKDSVYENDENRIVWFHRNKRSLWKDNLSLQALGEWCETHDDPLYNRTFGGAVLSSQMTKISDNALHTTNPVESVSISVFCLTKTTDTADHWIKALNDEIELIENSQEYTRDERFAKHKLWWNAFWNRSYIYVSSNDQNEKQKIDLINRGYALQRYMQACSGRGNFPIKFNGSIFTTDTENLPGKFNGFDADYRRWGGPYWWQNTRLPYWSMLNSGDFDLMMPLFRMYLSTMPLRKYATEKYFNHKGAHFPETMYFWGAIVDDNYGRDRKGKKDGITENGYIRRYWQGGLELSLMMLDYYNFTLDKQFAKEIALPFISEVLTFFDEHWPRNIHGKIRFEPAQALETYWEAVNPLPEIAGIKSVVENLLALPESLLSRKERERWKKLINDLPQIPMEGEKGAERLVPGDSYKVKKNIENPELYAIFPYRIYGINKPDYDIALRTFENRAIKITGGWQQNAIKAALLGLADTAANYVSQNFSTWNKDYRFPAMWGPNYDWLPDQCHGSVAMIALQRMILQWDGNAIYMLPAWPKNWNAEFKLHAPKNTIVTGEIVNGKLEEFNTLPSERKKDIKVLP